MICAMALSALPYPPKRLSGTTLYASCGVFDLPAGFGIEQQIFIDEKPDWYDLAQETPRLTGEQVIADAMAQGFTFD